VRRLNDVNVRARHYKEPTVPGDGDRFTVLDSDAATVVQFEDERLERRRMKHVPDFIDIHGDGRLTVGSWTFNVQGLPHQNTPGSTLNAQRSTFKTFNVQRSTLNAQRSVQRSTLNVQRSTFNAQRSTLNAHRSTLNAQRFCPAGSMWTSTS
jgi:hypothetical protein